MNYYKLIIYNTIQIYNIQPNRPFQGFCSSNMNCSHLASVTAAQPLNTDLTHRNTQEISKEFHPEDGAINR